MRGMAFGGRHAHLDLINITTLPPQIIGLRQPPGTIASSFTQWE